MSAHHDCATTCLVLLHDLDNHPQARCIERIGRLIQHKKPRVLHDRLGELQTLPHAQAVGANRGVASGIKPHAIECLPHALVTHAPADRCQGT